MEYDLTCPLARVVSGANTGQKERKSNSNSNRPMNHQSLPPTITIRLSEITALPTSSLSTVFETISQELIRREIEGDLDAANCLDNMEWEILRD